MAIVLGDAVAYLVLDSSQFDGTISNAASALSSFAKGDLQGFGEAAVNVGRSMTRAFTLPIAMAGKSIVDFGSDYEKEMSAVQAVSNATEEEMAKMNDAAIHWGEQTIYTAKEAGEAMYYMGLAGWSAEDSIAALGPVLNLAAAGALDLGRTSDIVTDTMTALGVEADGMTDGLNNAEMMANVFAAAMSNSNTTVDKMGETFKYVAPVAGALGFSMQDLALATGLMANVGVKASQAGTGLRQAYKNLIHPTTDAAAAMEKYGITLDDGTGKAKSFRELMEDLRATFGNIDASVYDSNGELRDGEELMEEFGKSLPTSELEKINAIVTIFGVRAMPGMLGIINQSDEKFNQLADAIDNSDQAFVKYQDHVYTMTDALDRYGEKIYDASQGFEILGAAEGMAFMQTDNLYGSWVRFTSALGTAKIEIFNLIKEPLRKLIDALTDAVRWFNGLSDSQQMFIIKAALVVAAIGPILTVIGKLAMSINSIITLFGHLKGVVTVIQGIGTAFKSLGGVIKGIGGALSAAKNGFAAIAGSLGSLATVVIGFVSLFAGVGIALKSFVEMWQEGFSWAKEAVLAVGAALTALGVILLLGLTGVPALIAAAVAAAVAIIAGAVIAIKDHWEEIKEAFRAMGESIKEHWESLCESIKNAASAIADWFKNMFEKAKTAFTNFIKGITDLVKNTWEAIKNLFGTIKDWLSGWFETLKENLGTWFETIKESVVEKLASVWEKVKEAGEKIKDGVEKFFGNIYEKIKSAQEFIVGLIHRLGEALNSAFEFIFGSAWEKIQHLGDTLLRTIKNVIDAVTGLFNTMKGIFEEILAGLGNAILKIIDIITNGVKSALEGIQRVFQAVVGTFADILSKLTTTIGDAFVKAITFLEDKINELWDKVKSLPGKFLEFGKNIISNFWDGLKSVWENVQQWFSDHFGWIVDLVNDVIDKIKSIANSDVVNKAKSFINGSHANGLEYVPYDGYIAELHKGERVLTRSENQEYSSGNNNNGTGGDVYNFYNTQSDPYEIARQVRRTKKELAFAQ